MSLFGKRKLYKVIWRYDEFCSPSVDFVKATDAYKAWKKSCSQTRNSHRNGWCERN